MISRRKLLELAVVSPFAAALARADDSRVKIERRWKGPICFSQVTNHGREPVKLNEVVLLDLKLTFPPTTKLYGEGFQMLSQTGGTLGQPTDLGNYTDAKHYKLPAPPNTKAIYGMMMLSPSPRHHQLLAFTSCRRFAGQFYLNSSSIKVVVDTEGRELRPGETWQLESFISKSGGDREQLLDDLATQLVANHPPLKFPAPPTGWCSGARHTRWPRRRPNCVRAAPTWCRSRCGSCRTRAGCRPRATPSPRRSHRCRGDRPARGW